MDFGEVISRAWKIIWKHKVLWIFGILAGCVQANQGGSENLRYTFQGNELSPYWPPPSWQNYFNNLSNLPGWAVALLVTAAVLAILIFIVLIIFLSTIGRVGLYRGTLQADQGADKLIFGELFSGSFPFFWRVFGLNLLVGLALFLIVLLLVALMIPLAVVTLGIILICLIPLICLLVPIFWLIGILVEQANLAIVIEDIGILEGLRRAWEVFKNNLGPMVVMGLILNVAISWIGSLIIGLPFLLVVAPLAYGAISGTGQAIQNSLVIAGICFVLYLPVLLILSGILRSYIESAWTLTYLRLTRRPALPSPEPVIEPEPAPL